MEVRCCIHGRTERQKCKECNLMMGGVTLTKAMKAQLLEYIKEHKELGYYWGNKEQFWARHEKIMKWVEGQQTK